MIRWPGTIEAGSVSNEIVHHMDWLPTFAKAAGAKDIKDDLLDGHERSDLMDLQTVVPLEIWNDGLWLVEPTARREY